MSNFPSVCHHSASRLLALFVLSSALLGASAEARTLAEVQSLGAISMCANPDAMPHSTSKDSTNPGYQVEIGRAIAESLGLKLNVEWIFPRRRANVVNCDMMMDTVNDPPVYEGRLLLSVPYHMTGIALGLARNTEGINSFRDFKKGQKLGVMVGSLSSVVLGKRGVSISPYAFQSDMIEDLMKGELVGAALSPATMGYYVSQHPDAGLRMVNAYDNEPELAWTVAIGLRKSDPALLAEINKSLSGLLADGSLTKIFAKYGIEHRIP
jgi:polar amino acid transport system substrate-binding protein